MFGHELKDYVRTIVVVSSTASFVYCHEMAANPRGLMSAKQGSAFFVRNMIHSFNMHDIQYADVQYVLIVLFLRS